jgi:hypothetical protein
MTKTLTDLIAMTQAQLIDDGTRFTTATCTAAIRAALSKWNHRVPLQSAHTLEAVTDQREYEVENALFLSDVLLFDQDGQDDLPLQYNAYTEDNRVYFRLRQPQAASEILLARYAQAHTINGLDDSQDSTLSDDQSQVIVDGACLNALQMRGASRVEPFNLNNNVEASYKSAMESFRAAFEMGIQYYERRLIPPSSQRQSAWISPGWQV